MFECKVFDKEGKLKRVISREEVIRLHDETFAGQAFAKGGKTAGRLTVKAYVCVMCKVNFESKSSRGAKYCKDCRPGAYKRSRKEKL